MNRVAIVTGAARGIGAACVDALVGDGYRVVAVDRCRDIPDVPYALATPADLEAVVARHGDRALGLVGDVRSAEDMALAVETAARHFGRLDAVVAAAGVVAAGGPLWEAGDAAVDAVWSVNVLGTRRPSTRWWAWCARSRWTWPSTASRPTPSARARRAR